MCGNGYDSMGSIATDVQNICWPMLSNYASKLFNWISMQPDVMQSELA